MKFNKSGFSLVQVMISIAMLGGVSLAFMQIMKNMDQGSTRAKSSADEAELRSEIKMILDNKKFCRVSLAGNGPEDNPSSPVTFQKRNIDQETEGLDVELWFGDQQGNNRTTKKFSGTDNTKNKYGNITIKSIKLLMNNGTGSNYTSSFGHSDIGKIKVLIEKKMGTNDGRDLILDFPVVVKMSTNSSGVSTILSCSSQTELDTAGFLKNCSWESYDFVGAYRAYRTCSNGKKIVSGTCSCASDNCGGGATPGIIYSFTPLTLTVPECICSDWTCSNCNDVRINCSGSNCNAFECSYTQRMGHIYLKIFCCDY